MKRLAAILQLVDKRAGLGDGQPVGLVDLELPLQQAGQVDPLAISDGVDGPHLALRRRPGRAAVLLAVTVCRPGGRFRSTPPRPRPWPVEIAGGCDRAVAGGC